MWTAYQGYHAHISAIDREIGRVLAAVEELGLVENTIIIYTSDHGSMFGSHKKDSKRHPEEESIRVPFLARWPKKFKPGLAPRQLFGTIDLFPTLCGLAGVNVPPTCHGTDLSRIFFGDDVPGPASQFIMHISNKKEYEKVADDPKASVFRAFFRGVRTPRYTYTVGVNGPWQLFDNEQDPYQLNNLVGTPAAAVAQKECAQMLDDWLAQAEYAYMPDDLRKKVLAMSLPDRIAYQNIEAVQFAKAHKGSGTSAEGE
jgi:arylsulfatase A-like enzyme